MTICRGYGPMLNLRFDTIIRFIKNTIIQVTIEYRFDHGACVPLRVHTVVLSSQHSPDISIDQVRHHLEHDVVRNVIPEHLIDKDTVLHLNPCGPFTMGGPMVCIYSIL